MNRSILYLLLFIYIIHIAASDCSQCHQNAFRFTETSYNSTNHERFWQLTDSLTLELWVKLPIDYSSNYWAGLAQAIFDTGTNEGGYGFQTYGSNYFIFLVATPHFLSASDLSDTKFYLPSGVYNHIAGTYDGYTTKVYINGSLAMAFTNTTLNPISYEYLPHSFYIGRHKDDNEDEYFNGSISNVRLWSYARSQSQISNDMYSCLDTCSSKRLNLLLDIPFNETDIVDQNAYDYSGNHYDLIGNHDYESFRNPSELSTECDPTADDCCLGVDTCSEFCCYDKVDCHKRAFLFENDSYFRSSEGSNFWAISTFSLDFWIRPYSTSSSSEVVGIHSPSSNGYQITMNELDKLVFSVPVSGLETVIDINSNYFNHIAISSEFLEAINQVCIKIYVNGTLVSTEFTGTFIFSVSNDYFTIGQSFYGMISTVRLWNYVRSSVEIQDSVLSCYDSSLDCIAGLLFYLPLNGSVETHIKDYTSHHNDFTIVGDIYPDDWISICNTYDSSSTAYDSSSTAYDSSSTAYDSSSTAYDSSSTAYDSSSTGGDPIIIDDPSSSNQKMYILIGIIVGIVILGISIPLCIYKWCTQKAPPPAEPVPLQSVNGSKIKVSQEYLAVSEKQISTPLHHGSGIEGVPFADRPANDYFLPADAAKERTKHGLILPLRREIKQWPSEIPLVGHENAYPVEKSPRRIPIEVQQIQLPSPPRNSNIVLNDELMDNASFISHQNSIPPPPPPPPQNLFASTSLDNVPHPDASFHFDEPVNEGDDTPPPPSRLINSTLDGLIPTPDFDQDFMLPPPPPPR